LNNNSILTWISKSTGIYGFLEEKSQDAFLPLGSNEFSKNVMQLQIQQVNLRNPFSILEGMLKFLFLPAPFVDNGSFFLNAQSYESFAWYLYYTFLALLVFGLFRGKYISNVQSIVATSFSLGFIPLSALVEINFGTSVRHRSVLLIGILIMLAVFREKDGETKPSNFTNTIKNP
jgi:hypothetical protein